MSSAEPTPARRYKDVIAGLTVVAREVRTADQARAAALRQRLVRLDDEMVRVNGRALLTEAVVRMHWERALDLLWAESWMKLRLLPEPDEAVDPARLDDLDAEVARRADALREVVRRRWYELGRR